jgi:DCN1-like protein 1/2
LLHFRSDSLSKQKNSVNHLRRSLPKDEVLFKQVYRHTFLIARTPGQKSVALDAAIEYWKLLFTPPGGLEWSTSTTPWLNYWLEFVTTSWSRAINKDMWNMLLEFVGKTRQDEAFGWWDEGGAWPSVLDSFVGFVKEKREAQGKMEVE